MQLTANVVFLVTLAATLASASVIPRQAESTYTQTFANQTGAVQAVDFITFGLFDTTAGTFFLKSSFGVALTSILFSRLHGLL